MFPLICAVLTGCTRTDVSEDDGMQKPVLVIAQARPSTKGYVTGTALGDTPYDGLHDGSAATDRDIVLSAHILSGDTVGDYFTGETFSLSSGVWCHDPKYYWPLASTLSFLGYSSSIPFEDNLCEWGIKDCSASLALTVPSDCTQNDIVFGSVYGAKSSDGGSPVSMLMKHSQAWIELRLKVADASMDSIFTVSSVILNDIYTSGELDLDNNHGDALGTWSFRLNRRQDTVMDDNLGVYGVPLTTETSYLDMLIPEQDKKTITLNYLLSGSDLPLVHNFPLSLSTWQMGYKYIYDITISPHGISVVPSVEEWSTENSQVSL